VNWEYESKQFKVENWIKRMNINIEKTKHEIENRNINIEYLNSEFRIEI
jgi:hypothetical protein